MTALRGESGWQSHLTTHNSEAQSGGDTPRASRSPGGTLLLLSTVLECLCLCLSAGWGLDSRQLARVSRNFTEEPGTV